MISRDFTLFLELYKMDKVSKTTHGVKTSPASDPSNKCNILFEYYTSGAVHVKFTFAYYLLLPCNETFRDILRQLETSRLSTSVIAFILHLHRDYNLIPMVCLSNIFLSHLYTSPFNISSTQLPHLAARSRCL